MLLKQNLKNGIFLILYVFLLPYLSRVFGGLDFVMQYAQSFGGVVTFAIMAAIVAIPLIVTCMLRKVIPVTFWLSFVFCSALTVYWHHNYDLSVDAQAGVGLIFIAIFVFGYTLACAVIVGLIEWLTRKCLASSKKD